MKLDFRRAEALFRSPEGIRVVLLHGEDAGRVREYSNLLTQVVAGRLDDPFRVSEVGRDSQSRIGAEAAALSLTGGRRVVRVRDPSDSSAKDIQVALDGPGEALLIVECGPLPARSKLRELIEPRADGWSVACYNDGPRDLVKTIRQTLAAREVSITEEALERLNGQLGSDHAATLQELEKLGLFVGPGGEVDVQAAMASVGDRTGLQLEDALFAATAGDLGAADRALDLIMAEGTSPITVIRAALTHLQRLSRVKAAVDGGIGAADAIRSLRPPIFFRNQEAFTAALHAWTTPSLSAACKFVSEAEQGCKQTGAPGEQLCRHVLWSMARQGTHRVGHRQQSRIR